MIRLKNSNFFQTYEADELPKLSEIFLTHNQKIFDLNFSVHNDMIGDPNIFSLYLEYITYYFSSEEMIFFSEMIIDLFSKNAIINKKNLLLLAKVLGKKFVQDHVLSQQKHFNKIKFQTDLSSTPLYHGMSLSSFKLAIKEGGIVGRSSFRYDLKEDFKINYEDRVKKLGLGLLERPYVEYKGICLSRDLKISESFGDIILIFDREKIRSRYKLEVRRCFYDMTKNFSKYEKEEFLVLDKKSNMHEVREKVLKKMAAIYEIPYRNEKEFLDEFMKEFSQCDDPTNPGDFFKKEFHNAYYFAVKSEEDAAPSRNILPFDEYLIGFILKDYRHYSSYKKFSWYSNGGFEKDLERADKLLLQEIENQHADDFVAELIKDKKFLGFHIL